MDLKTAALCFNANKSTNAPSWNLQKKKLIKSSCLESICSLKMTEQTAFAPEDLGVNIFVSVSQNDPWLFSGVECKFLFSLYHLTTLQGVLHVLFHPERLRRSADKARSVERRAVLENTHAASEY